MRTILFVLLFTLTSLNGKTQSIIAGSWSQWDHYYDYIPDTAIYISSSVGTDSVKLDINGDGTNDVTIFHKYHQVWNWGHERSFWIRPEANTEIVFLEIDSCWSGDTVPMFAVANAYAKGFDINNVIDNSATWVDSALYFYWSKADVTQPSGSAAGYNCFHTTVWAPMAPFLGVRIFTPDTLYGWIKPKIIHGASMADDTLHLDSYACQTSLTGINSITANSELRIVPNPSSGIFHVNAFFDDATVRVMDMTGRIILETKVLNEGPTFDLSAYDNGTYFISITDGKGGMHSQLILVK